MFRLVLTVCVFTCYLSAAVDAQAPSSQAVDPVFVRAQTLVSDGNGTAGRALVDSVLAATPPNAPLYPQALFWRASLASNAADAESDYKHIVVDYPLAPQAEDALLRLAQLELARGDRDAALAHLQRIPRDYPSSKSLARANYWTARVLFEKNDIADACLANSNALAQASADEVELRNQIQYQSQRCPVAQASAISVKPSQPDTVSPSGTPQTASSIGSPDHAPPSAVAATGNSAKPDMKSAEDAKAVVSVGAAADSTKRVAATRETRSGTGGASSHTTAYSVQVAAYNHRADAEKLAAGLLKRGYEARVDGDIIPFRVRIGRYSTAVEAENALKRIKAKHIDGFVVRAAER